MPLAAPAAPALRLAEVRHGRRGYSHRPRRLPRRKPARWPKFRRCGPSVAPAAATPRRNSLPIIAAQAGGASARFGGVLPEGVRKPRWNGSPAAVGDGARIQ